jgi:hypothetical protein
MHVWPRELTGSLRTGVIPIAPKTLKRPAPEMAPLEANALFSDERGRSLSPLHLRLCSGVPIPQIGTKKDRTMQLSFKLFDGRRVWRPLSHSLTIGRLNVIQITAVDECAA